jgi:hypothetical protein
MLNVCREFPYLIGHWQGDDFFLARNHNKRGFLLESRSIFRSTSCLILFRSAWRRRSRTGTG